MIREWRVVQEYGTHAYGIWNYKLQYRFIDPLIDIEREHPWITSRVYVTQYNAEKALKRALELEGNCN